MVDSLARRYGKTPGQVVAQDAFDMGLMLAAAQAGAAEEKKQHDEAMRKAKGARR